MRRSLLSMSGDSQRSTIDIGENVTPVNLIHTIRITMPSY